MDECSKMDKELVEPMASGTVTERDACDARCAMTRGATVDAGRDMHANLLAEDGESTSVSGEDRNAGFSDTNLENHEMSVAMDAGERIGWQGFDACRTSAAVVVAETDCPGEHRDGRA